jgi:hypothetical protein
VVDLPDQFDHGQAAWVVLGQVVAIEGVEANATKAGPANGRPRPRCRGELSKLRQGRSGSVNVGPSGVELGSGAGQLGHRRLIAAEILMGVPTLEQATESHRVEGGLTGHVDTS